MTRIYLDNASTTPIDHKVLDRMIAVMKDSFGNPSSIHHHGRVSKSIIEDARKKIAYILKASIGEIFFTSSATESINTALKNSVHYLGVKHIISSPTEHHCVFHTLDHLADQYGVTVTYLDVDDKGNPDLTQLETLLHTNPEEKKMVTLMHANNEIGTMLDMKKVGELCQATDTLFQCDTVQSLGKFDINLSETYTSFISGSAHKFHGPKGVGFLYMNMDNIIPPYLHGGAQERNMRAGTENIYGIVGQALALEIAHTEREDHKAHILGLRDHFKQRLTSEFVDIRFNGNQEDHFLYHVLSVSFLSTPKADMLMFNLDISGISASSGSACSSGIASDSHVLTAIGHPSDRKTIRFSFSKYNTLEEIDTVVEKLKSLTPTS